MNDQIILRVTKRNGGLEVNTSGTGNDQLAAIKVAAAATFRVLVAGRRLPEEMATSVIASAVLDGIAVAKQSDCGMREIRQDRPGK